MDSKRSFSKEYKNESEEDFKKFKAPRTTRLVFRHPKRRESPNVDVRRDSGKCSKIKWMNRNENCRKRDSRSGSSDSFWDKKRPFDWRRNENLEWRQRDGRENNRRTVFRNDRCFRNPSPDHPINCTDDSSSACGVASSDLEFSDRFKNFLQVYRYF